MLSEREVIRMLWRADNERAGGERVQLNLTVTPEDRELLRQTAEAARITQTGTLRLGLRLAARVVGELVKQGR